MRGMEIAGSLTFSLHDCIRCSRKDPFWNTYIVHVWFKSTSIEDTFRCDFTSEHPWYLGICNRNEVYKTLWMMMSHSAIWYDSLVIHPATKFMGVYWIHAVRPSIRPSAVDVRMITRILFIRFQFFGICITWVNIFDGIGYEYHTSFNMRIMAGHLT